MKFGQSQAAARRRRSEGSQYFPTVRASTVFSAKCFRLASGFRCCLRGFFARFYECWDGIRLSRTHRPGRLQALEKRTRDASTVRETLVPASDPTQSPEDAVRLQKCPPLLRNEIPAVLHEREQVLQRAVRATPQLWELLLVDPLRLYRFISFILFLQAQEGLTAARTPGTAPSSRSRKPLERKTGTSDGASSSE